MMVRVTRLYDGGTACLIWIDRILLWLGFFMSLALVIVILYIFICFIVLFLLLAVSLYRIPISGCIVLLHFSLL